MLPWNNHHHHVEELLQCVLVISKCLSSKMVNVKIHEKLNIISTFFSRDKQTIQRRPLLNTSLSVIMWVLMSKRYIKVLIYIYINFIIILSKILIQFLKRNNIFSFILLFSFSYILSIVLQNCLGVISIFILNFIFFGKRSFYSF